MFSIVTSLFAPARSIGHARGLVSALMLAAGAVPAVAETVEAQYSISLAGFTVGRASLSGVVEPSSYTLNVSAALTGLMGAVTKGHGAATARGQLANGSVLGGGFSLAASNGTTTRKVQIGSASSRVTNVVIDPPFEDNPDRVPMKDSHKTGVLDPVSALVMPSRAADPMDKANCDRKIPVYDGLTRFDVVLQYAGIRQVKGAEGYSGPVLVCSARYVPLAGHRPNRRVTKFMAENKAMDAWLAPVNQGRVLIPYRISVKTMVGTTVIEATKLTGLR